MKLNGRSGLSSAAFPIVAQYSSCEVIERCSTFDLVLASLARLSEMRITVLMLQYVALCSFLSILFLSIGELCDQAKQHNPRKNER